MADERSPEADLFATRDTAARAELARRYDDLAARLARRFVGRGEDIDDLTQVARMALIKAIDRYEEGHGASFATYGTRTIVGELKRHLRDKAWSVRVPRTIQERALEVSRAVQDATQRLGRSPAISEVAQQLGYSTEEVLEAMSAGGAYSAASLDAPHGDSEGLTMAQSLGTLDSTLTTAEERVTLGQAITGLDARSRAILNLRFFEGKTQSEIAAELDISQMHVSRLLRRALDDLRSRVSEGT